MAALDEQHLVGLEALAAATALLQRGRRAHPTKGLYEAADLQWWWRTPRPTDEVPQLVWFDHLGRAEAAVILTDWGDHIAFDPIVLPDAAPALVAHVVGRGLAHAAAAGYGAVQLEVDRTDDVLRDELFRHGFVVKEDGLVETWMEAGDRPAISALDDGYRLTNRLDTEDRPHHMVAANGPAVASRLLQTSLYRPDLDLVVVDHDGEYAARGLFWLDPATATGLVEPMATEEGHRRRGLARHVLTSGLDRLAAAGAARIKIIFEPGNVAARDLYLGLGFRPVKETVVLAGPVGAPTSATTPGDQPTPG